MAVPTPLSLAGSIPALVTPFLRGDPASLDQAALARLLLRAADRGSAAVVVCGSTGEAPALHAEEQAEAIACAVRTLNGRIPVIAGVGAPSTEAAIGLAIGAERCGAAALLVSAPPYVRPTQEGLRAHIRAVAAATALPIMLYDVPSRTAVAFADDTVGRLRAEGAICAIKDASGDLGRPARLRQLCGNDFAQFSGDDATALAHRAMGGVGCVSVTANLVPTFCAAMHAAWDAGDPARACRLAERLAPLHALLFTETNPIPVKAALGLLGLCDPTPRLPLTPAVQETRRRLTDVLPALVAEDELMRPRPRRAA